MLWKWCVWMNRRAVFRAETLAKPLFFLDYAEFLNELPKKNELNLLIFENLRLYNEGITSIEVAEGCLKFWNSLEGVTKINKKDHVPERVNSILRTPSPNWILKMEILRDKRNLYAHKNISEFHIEDRNFLQKVSEEMFIFLINHSKMLKSIEDLDILFSVASKSTKKLKLNLIILNEN